jgi:LysR family transcriptional regulator, mexEF-oprN operon transcriptional activator
MSFITVFPEIRNDGVVNDLVGCVSAARYPTLRMQLPVLKLIEMNKNFNEIDFRGFDLNVLLAFTALMRERSVTKAAQRLLLGPSAISMALKRLRKVFNDPLLVRTRAGMEPTPRALALYERIEQALAELHAVVFEPEIFDPKAVKRTFRLGVPDDIELALIPMALQRIRTEAPDVKLAIRPSDIGNALDAIDSGDVDLALTAMPENLEAWHCVRVLHREHTVCLHDPKQVKIGRKITLKQYLALPHLLLSPKGEAHTPIDDRLHALGRRRQIMMAVGQLPLMPFLLRATPSLVNMPATAARFYAREFGLQLRELPIDSPSFDVVLLWHARSDSDPALRWFANLIEALVGNLREAEGSQRRGPALGASSQSSPQRRA